MFGRRGKGGTWRVGWLVPLFSSDARGVFRGASEFFNVKEVVFEDVPLSISSRITWGAKIERKEEDD
jgi:hypothetical protein